MSTEVADRTTVGEKAPEILHEDDVLRVSGLRGGDAALIVAFTGVGHRLGALQREEFVRTAQAGGRQSVLFVQDKTRSWYNEPSFLAKLEPIVAAWAERCARTVTLGNSMGGFGAVTFAGALKADTAIAFSPQYSVSPNVVPQEVRWRDFREKIETFRYESAGPYMVDGCRYFIFQGDASRDWYQIGGFPVRPNVMQFVVRGGPHNLAALLRARGVLSDLVDACVANDVAAVEALALGRIGALRRTDPADQYAAGERPKGGQGEDDEEEETAETPPPPPPSDARMLKRYERRRERKLAERLDSIAAARAVNEERHAAERAERAQQLSAERAATLDRLRAEREARKVSAREARVAERRAAAIARGAELAAERRAARQKAPRGLRRRVSAFFRRLRQRIGLGSGGPRPRSASGD